MIANPPPPLGLAGKLNFSKKEVFWSESFIFRTDIIDPAEAQTPRALGIFKKKKTFFQHSRA